MAWVKIPKENHPLFLASLPRDPRISTVNMFGAVAAKVNGQMFGGLFARGFIVKLSAEDQKAALAVDGAEMFDPMGNGRVMRDTVFLPETVLDEPDELRGWLRKAFDHTSGLPPKGKKKAAGPRPAPARKKAEAKAVAKRRPASGGRPRGSSRK